MQLIVRIILGLHLFFIHFTLTAVAQKMTPSDKSFILGQKTRLRFGTLTPDLVADDPRLQQMTPFGLEPRIYLGQLLAKWTDKTGVRLEARDNDKDDSGRWQVMICLRNPQPIAESMDDLRSALSTKTAIWHWERTGVAPNFAYRLVRPANLEARNEMFRQNIQRDFENRLALSLDGLKMSSADLNSAAQTDPTGILNNLKNDTTLTSGIRLLQSNISRKELDALISKRDARIKLPFEKLDQVGKQFALERVTDFQKLNPHLDVAPPTGVSLAVEMIGRKATPSLMLLVDSEDGSSGGTYVGGVSMEKDWDKQIATDYRLRDDQDQPDTPKILTTILEQPNPEGSTPTDTSKSTILSDPLDATFLSDQDSELLRGREEEKQLLLLATASTPRINFIACLSQSYGTAAVESGVYGHTVKDLLDEFGRRGVYSKWRRNTLLLAYCHGFATNDDIALCAPFSLYRFVTDRLPMWSSRKQIPLSDLTALAALGTNEQIQSLFSQYPDPFRFLETGRYSKVFDLLRLLSQDSKIIQQLESSSGVPISHLPYSVRNALKIPADTPEKTRVIYRQYHESEASPIVDSFWTIKNSELENLAEMRRSVLIRYSYPAPHDWAYWRGKHEGQRR